ncbi:MAG: class I SAM-dependent methyltransferase [Terriglobia bacterium]
MNENRSAFDKVARWWAQSPEKLRQRAFIAWMEHEYVKKHINLRTTGDESLDWFSYILQRYFHPPVARALSLGSGDGGLERHALDAGAVERFDAYDASPGAIEDAKKSAKTKGLLHRVNYVVSDLNHLRLEAGGYDSVFASMSIHHVHNLEGLFEEVRAALKLSGFFIMNEYIGPTRFQLPPIQIKLINDLLKVLPRDFRRVIRDGKPTSDIKESHLIHPLTWFEENDPSEAARSAEILPLLQRFFRIVEFKPYGGTLLHFLLQDIVGNFDESQENDRAWLDILFYFEGALEDARAIDSDFALIVASPQKI